MKLTSIDALRRAAVEAKGKDTKPFLVRLADIRRDPACQPRASLDPANITKLARLYKAGTEVAPIVVAFRGDETEPVIVDGHHRHRALEREGIETAVVVAAAMTRGDAEWRAYDINDKHGVPLNSRARRGRFRLLVKQSRHVVKGGHDRQGQANTSRFMSYAELAVVVGVSKSTVRNWMRADFCDTFLKMGDNEGGGEGGAPPSPRDFARELETVREALGQVRAAFDDAPDHETRERMVANVASLLSSMRTQHEKDDALSNHWTPPSTPEDADAF